ncbi:MAG: M43 family zinc metalloprotease [Bacteroidota bacterium]
MKLYKKTYYILLLFSWQTHHLSAQLHRCATNEVRARHPVWIENQRFVEQQIKEALKQKTIENRTVLKIPVVVHVVWNQAEENISDEQILSQIEVLNTDFRARNTEFSDIPAAFRSVAADTEIEFCLAQLDARGRSTNGITRTFTNEIAIANNQALIKNGALGGADAWDSQRFLNIWVGLRDDNILGEATLPGEASAEEDGIVMDYRAFGTIGTVAGNEPYILGRTLTHEVGHYLGLQHLWGSAFDNASCQNDDGISDTPLQQSTYSDQCPNQAQRSCSSLDMYMNFMNFTDDACMSMFSLGQKERMLAVLQSIRANLVNNVEATCKGMNTSTNNLQLHQIQISPNPTQDVLRIVLPDHLATKTSLCIYNVLGQKIHHAQILNQREYLLSLASFASGIYYLHFHRGEQHLTKTVVLE